MCIILMTKEISFQRKLKSKNFVGKCEGIGALAFFILA